MTRMSDAGWEMEGGVLTDVKTKTCWAWTGNGWNARPGHDPMNPQTSIVRVVTCGLLVLNKHRCSDMLGRQGGGPHKQAVWLR